MHRAPRGRVHLRARLARRPGVRRRVHVGHDAAAVLPVHARGPARGHVGRGAAGDAGRGAGGRARPVQARLLHQGQRQGQSQPPLAPLLFLGGAGAFLRRRFLRFLAFKYLRTSAALSTAPPTSPAAPTGQASQHQSGRHSTRGETPVKQKSYMQQE